MTSLPSSDSSWGKGVRLNHTRFLQRAEESLAAAAFTGHNIDGRRLSSRKHGECCNTALASRALRRRPPWNPSTVPPQEKRAKHACNCEECKLMHWPIAASSAAANCDHFC